RFWCWAWQSKVDQSNLLRKPVPCNLAGRRKTSIGNEDRSRAKSKAADRSVRSTQTEKATFISERGLYLCRQLPTLPHTFACSTIGPAGLNFRVRDGNGWNPRGKITDNLEQRSLVVGRQSLAKD